MNNDHRVWVLDLDEHVLIKLQGLLQDSGFDTTTTWRVAEGLELMATGFFDFLVVGNRPPLLDASKILQNVRQCGVDCDCFVLGTPETAWHEYGQLLDRLSTLPRTRPLRAMPSAGGRPPVSGQIRNSAIA